MPASVTAIFLFLIELRSFCSQAFGVLPLMLGGPLFFPDQVAVNCRELASETVLEFLQFAVEGEGPCL